MAVSRIFLTLCILGTVLTGCSGNPSHDKTTVPLLLISIDGFRHDYFDLADTPALDRLREGGLHADSLHHVFPTKTFPTHYTIVTGRHPGTHGIVANSMWDPRRNSRFSLGNREAVSDGYWYQGGEPIWVTVERQGLTAATYFWPGSEARIHRDRPTYWKPFVNDAPHAERIEQVLAWLDLPDAERPDFLTLYFSAVDSAGHRDGARSESVASALVDIDRHLGDLLDGLAARDLLDNMHILLVSDHGMARVDFDQYILLDEYLDLSRVEVSDWGPAAQIWATDMSADEIVAALDGAHPHLRVWKREDFPARYHFGEHHRVPDVLAEADPEWMISNKPYMAGRTRYSLMGMHGWDPAYHKMHGGFVAHGPAFAAGSRSPAIRSIDLYPLMNHLLGTRPADHQGSLAYFQPYLYAAEALDYQTMALDCPGNEPGEVRLGPAHLALHWNERIHVLPQRTDAVGTIYESTDLRLTVEEDRVTVSIDGTTWNDCALRE